MISEEDVRGFQELGYLVARGLLDPRGDVEPLRRAYEQLFEGLATIYAAELGESPPDAIGNGTVGDRLAFLLGVSGGEALHHLAPVLGMFSPTFRFRSDLPPAQVTELFAMMRNAKLLDGVERLVGPEIFVSPIYHVNMKLAGKHLRLVETTADAARRSRPGRVFSFYDFEVGRTPWHADALTGLADSHESRIIIAWIPLTPADPDRGLLRLVPRSHRRADLGPQPPDELARDAVAIEAIPGDVVFLHNRVVHGATENRSADDVRLACNIRYLPIGESAGRPFLPGFVARSRSAPETELHNPYVWQAMWARALQHLTAGELPLPHTRTTSRARAERISRRWRAALPSEREWLRLPTHPLRPRPVRMARRLAVAVRRRIALWFGR